MELVVFSASALLVAGVFLALRPVRRAAGRRWRWVGTAASVVFGAVLVAVAVVFLHPAALLMAHRVLGLAPDMLASKAQLEGAVWSFWVLGLKPETSGLAHAGLAAMLEFWSSGKALFAVLGMMQGCALGLALSVVTEPDEPAVTAAFRLQTWRAGLGKAVVALPLPAALAVLLTFYQDNRDRFSSVGVGGFLTLALSPAPAGGSQQSAPEGGSGGRLLYSTDIYVERAQESLNGTLRQRDMALIDALRQQASNQRAANPEKAVPPGPTEADFEQTRFVERWHCGWLRHLPRYVKHFYDYNLLTLDVGEALSRLHIAWEVEARELDRWVGAINLHNTNTPFADLRIPTQEVNRISRHDSLHHLSASVGIFENLDRRARYALVQIGDGGSYNDRVKAPDCPLPPPRQDAPATGPTAEARRGADASGSDMAGPTGSQSDDAGPIRQVVAAVATPAPGLAPGRGQPGPHADDAATPPPWNAVQIRSRILDMHAPYRAIGTANFYAAIGSFETAYLVLRDWLRLDARLRLAEPALDAALPRWFKLRVLQESAEMYRNTSQGARSSEWFRRLLDDVVQEYRALAPEPPMGRRVGGKSCFDPPAKETKPKVEFDPFAALTLARVTSEIEFFDVSGLAGTVSQRHVDDAKKLTGLDFACFKDAFRAPRSSEEFLWVRDALDLYQARAVIAWGRLAVRWLDAGRISKRVSDDERKRMLGEVRVAVGSVVERLEHRARLEDEGRLRRIAAETRRGSPRTYDEGEAALDHARAARRVLQEALALDK